MKSVFFFFFFALSLSAYAGDKGNGEHPLSQVDDAFISQKDDLCPQILDGNIHPETITFKIEGYDHTYKFQVLRDYCEEEFPLE